MLFHSNRQPLSTDDSLQDQKDEYLTALCCIVYHSCVLTDTSGSYR